MIVIALGANLPSRNRTPEETLRAALAQFSERGLTLQRVSPFYVSQAWPDPNDPPFVNAVATVETELSPPDVMATLHATEEAFGRKRSVKNAPRTLDLDLIDYNGRVESGPPILPHPAISERAFVLMPLADIAPRWRHPVSGKMVKDLISSLPGGSSSVTRLG